MWDLIVNPFVTVLTLLYSVLGNNIVLAIAVFTVIVRLATSPLLIQQQRSTAAMQELQPQIEKLKELYKNDRDKLSQAQMELYREKGINPLGGCLPLLIQMPIILGLYSAIITALGSTPFQVIEMSRRLLVPGLSDAVPLDKLWLGIDLTQPPTFVAATQPLVLILPVLVMATTWLQSKLTIPPPPPSEDGKPNAAANMTRSMTTIMPLMFGFFALSFSVGLSIYFLVSNTVGIIQYTFMGRADWRRLFGLPEKEDSKKAKAEVDEVTIAKVQARVESQAATRESAVGRASDSSVSSRVLEAKPSKTPGNYNSSGTAKKKKRKKR